MEQEEAAVSTMAAVSAMAACSTGDEYGFNPIAHVTLLFLGMSSWAVAALSVGVAVAASAITAAAFLLRNRTAANRSLSKGPSGTTGAEPWIQQGKAYEADSSKGDTLSKAGVTMLSSALPVAVSSTAAVIGIGTVGLGRGVLASGADDNMGSPTDESDTVGLLARGNHAPKL